MSWFDDPRTFALDAIIAYNFSTVDEASQKAAPHVLDAHTALKERQDYSRALEHAKTAASLDARAGTVVRALEAVVMADQKDQLP